MSWCCDVEFKPSTVHGMGVFARETIKQGTTVWQFDDTMNVSDLNDLERLEKDRLEMALLGGYLHEPTSKFIWYEDGMQFVNHAEGTFANITTPEWLPLSEDKVVACRDIQKGEELFEDYGFWTIFNLHPDHWLRQLYYKACPGHYFFMQGLTIDRKAA